MVPHSSIPAVLPKEHPDSSFGPMASRLAEAACYIVLDHWLIGDGSKDGARTRRRLVTVDTTFPDLLIRAGFEEWTRLDALWRVREIFERIAGADRVGVSKEGFHRAAHRLAGVSGG